ncbi:MAG TPA: hypothetical protein VFT50_14225 [Baekduia sp.]|nr:hypothetical protein [Baekduia sp.]
MATKDNEKGIGVAQLADHLGTDARSLRAFLRRTERAVGRGTRYRWSSLKAPEVRKIETDWKAAQAPAAAERGNAPESESK